MKRIISLLLIMTFVFAFAGCTLFGNHGDDKTRETAEGIKSGGYDRNILTFLPDEDVEIVAVRYYSGSEYSRYEFEYTFEELDNKRISEFNETFRNIQYHTVPSNDPSDPGFGPDCRRGDQGIEMLLDNGRYLICDGRRLVLGNDPVDSKDLTDQAGSMCVIKITGCDYWDLMKQFFDTIE